MRIDWNDLIPQILGATLSVLLLVFLIASLYPHVAAKYEKEADMNEKKTTLNMSPREFNNIISDIDLAAELGDHNKVDKLTTILWEAMSAEDKTALRKMSAVYD